MKKVEARVNDQVLGDPVANIETAKQEWYANETLIRTSFQVWCDDASVTRLVVREVEQTGRDQWEWVKTERVDYLDPSGCLP